MKILSRSGDDASWRFGHGSRGRIFHKHVGRGIAAVALSTTRGSVGASAMDKDAKGSAAHIKAVTSAVDGKAIEANAKTTKDWLSYGLDYAETRFSKLDKINDGNVKNLGLMWTYNLESIRGVEATPLIVDGIMYVTAS